MRKVGKKKTHDFVGKIPLRLDGIYRPKKGALTTARRLQCNALEIRAREVLGDGVDAIYIDTRALAFIRDFHSITYRGSK